MNDPAQVHRDRTIPLLPPDVPLSEVRYIGVSLIEHLALFDDGTPAGCCWGVPLRNVKTWPGFDGIPDTQRASILAWRERAS
jgi:hypothetical protein